MPDPIKFIAKNDADTMNYYQPMKYPDQKKFMEKMVKDLNNHTEINHWKVLTVKEVTTGNKILGDI